MSKQSLGLTEQELNEMQARADKADDAPWIARGTLDNEGLTYEHGWLIWVSETQPTHGRATVASLTTDGLVGGGCNRGEIAPAYNDDDGQNSNAEFIAYARSDVPRLIAEVRRQQTTNEKLRDALQLLVTDVQDYEAWQRPCYALDVAQDALALVNR